MGDPLYQVVNFQAKESKDIEQTTFDSSLTLTFIHVHWTSIVVIYSLKVSTVPSLATWPSDLNINTGHLLSRGILTRSLTLTFALWPGNQHALGHLLYQDWQLSSKGVKRYLTDIAATYMCKTICLLFEKRHKNGFSVGFSNEENIIVIQFKVIVWE